MFSSVTSVRGQTHTGRDLYTMFVRTIHVHRGTHRAHTLKTMLNSNLNNMNPFRVGVNVRYLSSFVEFKANHHSEDRVKGLHDILMTFNAPIRYAVAYGSSIFSQGSGTLTKNTQTDFIFGVTHPEHWHSLNMRYNPDHYSRLANWAGSDFVSNLGSNYGTGLYFNTHVKINGETVKYGVTSIDNIMIDCAEWKTMYLAGRFQKPVLILRDDARVSLARRKNFRSAVRTALLLLPEEFTEVQLYSKIVSMSYMGDLRMIVGGENPNKVLNIVKNQFHLLRNIYLPIVNDIYDCDIIFGTVSPELRASLDHNELVAEYTEGGKLEEADGEGVTIVQDFNDTEARYQLFLKLPKHLQNSLRRVCRVAHSSKYPGILDAEPGSKEEGLAIVDTKSREALKSDVEHCLKNIVSWPSTVQTMKGVFSAGPVKSVVYASEKLKKGLFSGKKST